MLSSGFPVLRRHLENSGSPNSPDISPCLVEAVGAEPTTPAPKTLAVQTAESRLHDAFLLINNCAKQEDSFFCFYYSILSSFWRKLGMET